MINHANKIHNAANKILVLFSLKNDDIVDKFIIQYENNLYLRNGIINLIYIYYK
jgi:hypothetical protein